MVQLGSERASPRSWISSPTDIQNLVAIAMSKVDVRSCSFLVQTIQDQAKIPRFFDAKNAVHRSMHVSLYPNNFVQGDSGLNFPYA
jgi:hypothetical protein